MKEIKLGMYARIDGNIGKIVDICTCSQCNIRGFYEPTIEYAHEIKEQISYVHKDELEVAEEIIELIQEEDYVNGFKIVKIFKNENNGELLLIALQKENLDYEYSDNLDDYMCDDSIHIYNEDIKSVVTKEQFNSMGYMVQ